MANSKWNIIWLVEKTRLVRFNSKSTHLGLFSAEGLGNHIYCIFVIINSDKSDFINNFYT